MRRYSQRRPMDLEEAKALGDYHLQFVSPPGRFWCGNCCWGIKQLVGKQLSYDHHFRLADYLTRFRSHFRARMNPRRSGVIAYSTDEKLDELAIQLLEKLLLCSGVLGAQRLWTSLFDGEVV